MYNKREKKLIKDLVDYDFRVGNSQCLKCFDSFLSDRIFNDKNELFVIIRSDDSNIVYYKLGDFAQSFYYLAETFLLIKRLVENKLIVLLPVHSLNSITYFLGTQDINETVEKVYVGNKGYISKTNGQATWYDNNDKPLYNNKVFSDKQIPISGLLGSWPLITPELKALVNNNFKTTSDKSLVWTRIAAGISLCAMTAAVILPFCTTTRIDDKQYEQLINSMDKDINTEIVVQDTTDNPILNNEECENKVSD